jgi:hypothetical protein
MPCGLDTTGCTNNDGDGGSSTPCPSVLVSCNSNQTVWTSISVGDEITDDQINEIRDAIDLEYERRNYVRQNAIRYSGFDSNTDNVTSDTGTYTAPNPMTADQIVEDIHIEELYNQIAAMKTMTWTSNVKFPLANVEITAEQALELQAKINDCENDCLCNCDYCTCNCNYCTCNCNFCACNCNYCTCDCNHYGCTCFCNICDGHIGGSGCNGRGCLPLGGW